MENIAYPSLHTHSEYSNIRLLDSISKFKDILDYSLEIGLNGIALTDHECLSGFVKALRLIKSYREKGIIDNNFKFIIGDEIYLVNDIKGNQYHFILLAKDREGYELLKRLSTRAWEKSYQKGKMTRVPLEKESLIEIVSKNKGHLIASTACLGGELPKLILEMHRAEQSGEVDKRKKYHDEIVNFVLMCKDLFGDDFYFEIQPSNQREQITVNQWIRKLSEVFKIKIIVTTDAHYVKKEDRLIHKAYLTSKEGEREVDSFYESTYLMSSQEVCEWKSINEVFTEDEMLEIFNNTNEILQKVKEFDVFRTQEIPKVDKTKEVEWYLKNVNIALTLLNGLDNLKRILKEKDTIQLYWLYRIYSFLEKKNLLNYEYLSRIDLEAKELFGVSERLHDNVFSYYVAMTKLIDIAWNDAGAIVGPSRGSVTGFLSAYALEIQAMDSIKYNLPHWRHLTAERPEMPDIDFDTPASRRTNLLLAFKNYFGKDKVINIGTFKTEGTKLAILSACRGYRSEDYPEGIDIDIAQYLTSLIPVDRGKLWPLDDVVNGNKEKDRQPCKQFVNEVNKYEGLLSIITKIEGLICGRSIHASGIYITNKPYVEYNAMMKSKNGQEITQFDMEDSDYQGALKFDALTIEALDIQQACIELLIKDGLIEKKSTLKETYESVIGIDKLVDDEKYWRIASNREMLSCFQFDTPTGGDAISKVKPKNLVEAAHVNSLMRLMASEKGGLAPVDKFLKFKNNINLWYKEMSEYNLTKEEQKIIENHLLQYNGVAATQEDLMRMAMDEKIANFSIVEANKLRKAIAKKKEKLMQESKELFFTKGKESGSSENLLRYVWNEVALPQAGYSFSVLHTTGYTAIALQELTLFANYPSIYWNTAVLSVNADNVEEYIDENFVEKEYDEDGNLIEEKKKAGAVNYGKVARAIGTIKKSGINVAPPMINRAEKDFIPDVKNNRILYSLKALSKVGDNEIEQIMSYRPFASLNDYLERTNIKKPATISLIKSGAFDEIENTSREKIMEKYLKLIAGFKEKLNLQNFNSLINNNLLPEEYDFYRRLYNFNKYIRQKEFRDVKAGYLLVDDRSFNFLANNFSDFLNKDYQTIDSNSFIGEKTWKKVYDKQMDIVRKWLSDNQEELLNKYNNILYNEVYEKYGKGNISKWEMDSLSYYNNEHELANVNSYKYGISNFSSLDSEPEIESTFKGRNGATVPLYKLRYIIGTCIDKNNTRNSFTILTPDKEIVDIKLNTELYAMYNKRISVVGEDGKKKVKEDSWFSRGNKLMILGYRRGDNFVPKKYKKSIGHRLVLIKEILDNGDLVFQTERYSPEEE